MATAQEAIEVFGVEHVDLTVSNLERAEKFYRKVLTCPGTGTI